MRDSSTNLSPTYAEMAARFRSKVRSLRHSAARYGDTPKGRAALSDALAYEGIAAALTVSHGEQLAGRDGFLPEYRKAVANA